MSQQPKSCLACRVRHSKCDGTVPCAQCRLRNTNCTTTMPGKKDLPTDASGKELTEVYLEQLKMKPSGRQKKATEQPAMPNRGLTAQYLQTLPLHELVALAKHQEAEINDIDAKIYTASYRHYVDAEEDLADILGSDWGLPNDAPALADALVGAYVSRNVVFYPEGKVPVDMVAATSTLHRLISSKQFKGLITSTLTDMVDSFAYSVVFTYGAKILLKQDLAYRLAMRTERLLRVMTDNGLSKSPSCVNKVLSLMGFHTVVLIGLGLDDVVRNSIALQQFMALPNKSTVSATLISTVITHIAAITRDIPQRLRWIRAIEQLPSGSIPPYYDAYRVQHFAGDILLQEDGIHPFELLGKTPVEPELGLRKTILAHIDMALNKLPTYPPYTFRHLENAERSIKSIFNGAKAITMALLGNMVEAESLAEISIQTIQPEDLNFCTTVLVYSLSSALQVAIVSRKADLMQKGIGILRKLVSEIPRTARHISRLEDYANQIGFTWKPETTASTPTTNVSSVASPPVFTAHPDLIAYHESKINGAGAAPTSSSSASSSASSSSSSSSTTSAHLMDTTRDSMPSSASSTNSASSKSLAPPSTDPHSPFQAGIFSWATSSSSAGVTPSASQGPSQQHHHPQQQTTSPTNNTMDILNGGHNKGPVPTSPFTSASGVRPYLAPPFFNPMTSMASPLTPGTTFQPQDLSASNFSAGIGSLQGFPTTWNSPMMLQGNFPVSSPTYSNSLLEDQIFLGPAFLGQRTSHEMPHPLSLLGGPQQKHN